MMNKKSLLAGKQYELQRKQSFSLGLKKILEKIKLLQIKGDTLKGLFSRK